LHELEGFVIEEGRAFYRPVSSLTFDEAVALVRAAIIAARMNHASDLLIDVTGLTGFESPGVGKRFFAVEEWAEEAGGTLPVAMVLRSAMIHPQRFGVTVGINRGFVSNVFLTEREACAWLDAQRR
jgi:hypothetical protein